MGMRAVANIAGTSYYLQWGSPQYQVYALAAWLHACADTETTPTAENYQSLVAALDVPDAFTEHYPHTLTPDLDWTYSIEITPTEHGWTCSLDVRGDRLWAHLPRMVYKAGPVAFACTVTNNDLTALDAVAARYAAQMAEVTAQLHREGRGGPNGEKDAAHWARRAARWSQRATRATA